MKYEPREHEVSKREVERIYSKIPKEYFDPVKPNRINCYRCSCGHITKTIDKHIGVIPMFISCEKCHGQASSTFFNDVAPDKKPTIEWYRPTIKEAYKKFKRNKAMLDHISMGGLEMRRI